jgi:hypothetical protein
VLSLTTSTGVLSLTTSTGVLSLTTSTGATAECWPTLPSTVTLRQNDGANHASSDHNIYSIQKHHRLNLQTKDSPSWPRHACMGSDLRPFCDVRAG